MSSFGSLSVDNRDRFARVLAVLSRRGALSSVEISRAAAVRDVVEVLQELERRGLALHDQADDRWRAP